MMAFITIGYGMPPMQVKPIDWKGVGGNPHTLLYLPKWPNEDIVVPVSI